MTPQQRTTASTPSESRLVEAILRAVTMIATELLASSLDAMSQALGVLGEVVGVDRILVIEHRPNSAGGISAIMRGGWYRPGTSFELEPGLFEGFSPHAPGIAEWFGNMLRGIPVDASLHSPIPAVRELVARRQIESMVLVPIMVEGMLWGGFGIESKKERAWTASEINAFKTLGDVIAAAIIRERRLNEAKARLETIFSSVSEGIFVVEPGTRKVIDVNPAGCRLTGYDHDEVIGKKIVEFSSGIHPYTEVTAVKKIAEIAGGHCRMFEWQCRAKDGRLFWAEVSVQSAAIEKRKVFLTTVRDVTERKASQEQILQMACYDSLTGLANRRYFVETLEQTIDGVRLSSDYFAVFYLDLDHFKFINDTLGHPAGDEVLHIVSGRLLDTARQGDVVARFGGDEFAVLAVGMREAEDAAALAGRFLAALDQSLSVRGSEIRIQASIGITLYGSDAPDAEALLSQADVALYQAKGDGRGTYRFFTDAMDQRLRYKVALNGELRTAIDLGQFFLVYQPQVALDSGRITGVEALVRWEHPERGVLGPCEFIPIAESTGAIVALGRWVIREAARQVRMWIDSGIAPCVVAVNISGVQLKAARELEKDVCTVLAETGLPPQFLELELTESVLMDVSRTHNDVMQRLRGRGIRMALDDFGTGYSSLDYLRRYPMDRLKIAQAFVTDLISDPGSMAIVKATIGLAHELGLNVIAEGIETADQLKMLQAWGCGEGQGYYFASPLTVEEIEPLLQLEVAGEPAESIVASFHKPSPSFDFLEKPV